MYCLALRQSALLLVALLVVACGVPEVTAPPTVALPTASPFVETPIVASPAPATPLPSPIQATEPTKSALLPSDSYPNQGPACEMLNAEGACPTQVPTPQMPALPFDQALREFTGRNLVYHRYSAFIMLNDPRSGASLWLNGPFCPPEQTRDVYVEWSADRRFIAFLCQDNTDTTTAYLLDKQTGAGRQIAQGDAVEFAWSPMGSRLLVASQTDEQRAFILDAATDVTALPIAPYWERDRYPPITVGPATKGEWYIMSDRAAMAWSPDGTKIAVDGGGLSVIDADPTHVQAGMAPILASFPTSGMFPPTWHHDGRFLYVAVPHQIHDNPLSPSSQWGSVELRVEISSGIITDTDQDPYKLDATVQP